MVTKLSRLGERGGLAPHMSRFLMSSHMPQMWRCGAQPCTATDLQKFDRDSPEGLCLTPECTLVAEMMMMITPLIEGSWHRNARCIRGSGCASVKARLGKPCLSSDARHGRNTLVS